MGYNRTIPRPNIHVLLNIGPGSGEEGKRGRKMIVGIGIDLVTVFDAILKSRQTREKLLCLYENLMSNNFLKTAVLRKISIVN